MRSCLRWVCHPSYFFWSGNGDPRSAAKAFQRSYWKLFKLAKIQKPDGTPKRCHPHMFRDTFAVELLLAGVSLDQVSLLLGHSSVKITERHYAPFCKARQEQLAAPSNWLGGSQINQLRRRELHSRKSMQDARMQVTSRKQLEHYVPGKSVWLRGPAMRRICYCLHSPWNWHGMPRETFLLNFFVVRSVRGFSFGERHISFSRCLPGVEKIERVLCTNELPSELKAVEYLRSLCFGKSDCPFLYTLQELLNIHYRRPGLNHLRQLLVAFLDGACNLSLILFTLPSRALLLLLSTSHLGSLFCLNDLFTHYFGGIFYRLYNLRDALSQCPFHCFLK